MRTNVSRVALVVLVIYLGWAWWAVYHRAYDWRDNEASYKAMVRIDPAHKKAQFQLGEAYRLQGNIELARSQYQRALSIDPNYEEAKAGLARVSKEYKGEALSFYYPEDWQLDVATDPSTNSGSIHLTDGEREFEAKIDVEELKQLKIDEYLKTQKAQGELVNEGLAQIPNVESAWVKVWEGDGDKGSKESRESRGQMVKLQFFLFDKGKVVKILVYPANSPSMRVFDGILALIKIE